MKTAARTAAAGAALVGLAIAAAWVLAQPLLSPPPAAARAIADGAAVTVLGLAVVPLLDGHRYRDELMRRATGPLVTAAAVWLVAELVRLTLGAAEAADISVGQLSAQTTWDFATITAAGRSGVFSAVAAAAICAQLLLPPVLSMRLAVAGAASIGIAARAVTGHLAQSTVSATAVVLHALAAAVWCGILAALVLTVRTRGQWARVLPPFSRVSLIAVSVLLAGGTLSAVSRFSAPSDLFATGYGRILLAKIAVTLALLVLAWHYRRTWVPLATAHRVTAEKSRLKSLTELSLMAVALTLAAALTVTG